MTRTLAFLALIAVVVCLLWQARAVAPALQLPKLSGWHWDAEHIECIEYVVGIGDSIWSIAGRYYPNEPPAKIEWAIREMNGLQTPDGPILRPGQKLWIPDPEIYGVGRR